MLTQNLVTRYAKYHALKNLLDKWLEEQRRTIFELLGVRQDPETKVWSSSSSAPDKGPYLLEIGDAKNGPQWKEEFRAYLIGTGLSEADADLHLDIIAKKERDRSPRLYCKVNPNYRRKFEIRLPA